MYRIMKVRSRRKNCKTLYQYVTTTVDGVILPLELSTKEELDAKVEEMLTEGNYAKNDFVIVEAVDYAINITDYDDSGGSTPCVKPDDIDLSLYATKEYVKNQIEERSKLKWTEL